MRSKHRCLLSIEVYEFSGKDIGELREQYSHDRYLTSILPKYTFNKEYGNILDSDAYLQFVDEGEQTYTLFNIETVDKLLSEEISNAGIESLLKDVDLRPYIELFSKKRLKDFNRTLLSAEYLILELTYRSGGYFDSEYEVDLDVEVIGTFGSKVDDKIYIVKPR